MKEKRILIFVLDSDDPWVTLKFAHSPEVVRFKASGEGGAAFPAAEKIELQNEIIVIIDAVRQAYIDSTRESFSCYNK